jgi:hypothetical protein
VLSLAVTDLMIGLYLPVDAVIDVHPTMANISTAVVCIPVYTCTLLPLSLWMTSIPVCQFKKKMCRRVTLVMQN